MFTFATQWALEWWSDVSLRDLVVFRTLSADWVLLEGIMRACELLEPEYLVQMLRAVKHLSMNVSMLEVLQNANAIEILVRILNEHSSDLYSTVSSLEDGIRNLLLPFT